MPSDLVEHDQYSSDHNSDDSRLTDREIILRRNLERIRLDVPDIESRIKEWRTHQFVIHSCETKQLHCQAVEPVVSQIAQRCRGALIIEGVNPPWILDELMNASSPDGPSRSRQQIIVLQSDWNELFDGLSYIDLGEEIGSPRIRWFIGDDAPAQLLSWIEPRLDDAPPSYVIQNPLIQKKCSPDGQELMRVIENRWSQNEKDLITKVRSRPSRDFAWWADRFDKSSSSNEPLKVLIPVSRHTTYLKHAASDLAEAFANHGCSCEVIMERDETAIMSQSTTLRAIDSFNPDLIVSINYTRSSLGANIPRDIPHVCWIQDAMSHLFDPDVGASFGERDFIVGMVKPELVEQFGYPVSQCRWMPMVASRSKFSSETVANEFDSEIAWVTHQSEHPNMLRDRMIHEMRVNAPDAVSKFSQLLSDIEHMVQNLKETHLFAGMNRLVDEAFFPSGVPDAAMSLRSHMFNSMVVPYAERVFRHQTAQWAADIACRKGWSLKLYGQGWREHPTLSRFAADPVEHGDELRDCYRRSVVSLHASINQTTHQRVSECVLSGGLPLCRVVRDSFDLVSMQIAAKTELTPENRQNIWFTLLDECPSAAKHVQNLTRLGLCPDREFAQGRMRWLASQIETARSMMSSRTEQQNAEMFDSLTDLYFTSESQLESLLVRAVESPDWRRDRINSANSGIPKELTTEGFVSEVLEMIRSRLSTRQIV